MAITRAQQAKQMLQDGGMLVSPSKDGKRPGYRSERFQSARSKSMSAGKTSKTSGGGNPFSNQGSGDDNRQTYSAIQTQTGAVKGGGTRKGPPGSDMYETGYVTGDEGRAARDDFIRGVIENQPPEQKKNNPLLNLFDTRRR